jgi:UMF1 family MFS transporter
MVKYLGREMSTSSFAMYTSSTAVLMQAVVLILFSSFADHGMSLLSFSSPIFPFPWWLTIPGPYRKRMLTLTSYTGALSSTLFIFISPRVYYLAPLLTIIGVASLGCSFVLLNAFLPLLVANHPGNDYTSKPLAHPDDFELDEPTDSFELEALNPTASVKTSDADRLSGDLALSAKISSKGVGYGYISAVGVEILAIFIIYGFSKTSLSKSNPSLSIRVILLLVGLWWAIFTIPTLLWLRPRPGPPLPSQTKLAGKNSSKLSTFIFYTAFSLRSFWGTLRLAVALRQTLIFLLSWFLLSDAVATISGTAVLFARTELHMSTIPIALLSITSIGSGILGAFAWPLVQARYSLAPKTILLLCVAGMEIIPLYGLLGYVPHSPIGLLHVWEIYPVAVVHGVVMGGISSYARSVFSPLVSSFLSFSFLALF